jgi:hypothetical protein
MRALKPGLRLRSAVCSTEVMILRAPAMQADLRCGGAEMLGPTDPVAVPGPGSAPGSQSTGARSDPEPMRLDPAFAGGTLLGKRYVDAQDRVEILCTKGGAGSLVFDGVPMTAKLAKALPSSD